MIYGYYHHCSSQLWGTCCDSFSSRRRSKTQPRFIVDCVMYMVIMLWVSVVKEWCRKFRDAYTDVTDEGGQEWHSIVTNVLIQKVNQCTREKCRFMISELSEEFPQTSRTILYLIVVDRLVYRKFCAWWVHKFCAWWVPKQLTEVHKTQRMGSALKFLRRFCEEAHEFLHRIVTGDKTCVQFVNAETKEQSKQWMHTHSPNKPKKFKQTLSKKNYGYNILGL